MGVTNRGMTLIEAVVATAVVMVVVIAASRAVACVEAATAGAGGRAAAETAVSATIAELRSLPFTAYAGAGPAAPGAVSRVFPHAGAGPDSPDAFFAPEAREGCPAGTFFTREPAAGGRMTIAATFVAATAAGWQPVPAARLAGFDVRRAAQLPSSALLVRVSVVWKTGAHAGAVTRSTILRDCPNGPCRLAPPGAQAAT